MKIKLKERITQNSQNDCLLSSESYIILWKYNAGKKM
jgi:hypothetical protein